MRLIFTDTTMGIDFWQDVPDVPFTAQSVLGFLCKHGHKTPPGSSGHFSTFENGTVIAFIIHLDDESDEFGVVGMAYKNYVGEPQGSYVPWSE